MKKIFFFLIIVIFFSCGESQIIDIQAAVVNDIVISENHLGFPDLIRYNDMWYVIYRESDGHVGTYGIVKVLKSKDFNKWEEIFTCELEGWDLRDPKFSWDKSRNKLYLHFHAAFLQDNRASRKDLYIEYNHTNGFSINDIKEICVPHRYKNIWLWRPEWNNGIFYCIGYNPAVIDGIALFIYPEITASPDIIPLLEYIDASEATIRFNNDDVYCLVRRNNDNTFLGKATIDKIDDFSWSEIPLFAFGGPNMLLTDGAIFIGGRQNGLFIGKMNPKNYSITEMEKLPAGGDSSYPGMVLFCNELYIVYYAQKDGGFVISSGIMQI
jgi:hypothetical protein